MEAEDIVDLKNIDPDLIDEYMISFPEIAHEIFELETNAKHALSSHNLHVSAEEGVLVKKMIEDPKAYGLRKTTNNDITYALARDPGLFQLKKKTIDLEKEVEAAQSLRRTLYIKRDMIIEMYKDRAGRIGLETKGNSIADRKRNR